MNDHLKTETTDSDKNIKPTDPAGSLAHRGFSSSAKVPEWTGKTPRRLNGEWRVIFREAKPQRVGGGGGIPQYKHYFISRPATEDEIKEGRIREIESTLKSRIHGPDDDRGRDAYEAETVALQEELQSLKS